jgi:hypothetical protein
MEGLDMVTFKTSRRAEQIPASCIPDDCAVVGCALTAVAALFLMMAAGTAKAEQSDFVFYDLSLEQACETSGPACALTP